MKKLKKRYNELEGYLYDDSDDEKPTKQIQPKQEVKPQPQPTPEVQSQQPQQLQPQPYTQYRFHRSWRDIRPQ